MAINCNACSLFPLRKVNPVPDPVRKRVVAVVCNYLVRFLVGNPCTLRVRGFVMLRKEGYLRVKGAAQLLGVSPNTVRAWGAQGKIP